MATHSSFHAWEILWTEGAWQATVHGVTKSQTKLSTHVGKKINPEGSPKDERLVYVGRQPKGSFPPLSESDVWPEVLTAV